MTHALPDRRRRLVPLGATVMALAWTLSACGSGSEASTTTTTTPPATTVAETTTEPTDTTTSVSTTEPADRVDTSDCPTAAAVGDSVGSNVDRSVTMGGRGSTDGPSVSAEGCRYELADEGGAVSITRLTADDDVEDPLFPALEAAAEADAARDGFAMVDDLGDAAFHDGPQVAVLAGDRIAFVGIDVGFDAETDELVQALAAARSLARPVVDDADLSATDEALCRSVTAAVADQVTVTATTQSGGVIASDDVTIETERCSMDLDDGRTLDVSVADAEDWDALVESKSSSMFATGFERTSLGEQAAYDTGTALVVATIDQPLEVTTEGLDLDAEAAAQLRVRLAELTLYGR